MTTIDPTAKDRDMSYPEILMLSLLVFFSTFSVVSCAFRYGLI